MTDPRKGIGDGVTLRGCLLSAGSEDGDLDEAGRERAQLAQRYSAELDSPQRRSAFADRLRDALQREALSSQASEDSSYAVGISVAGTGLSDEDIRLRRGGSRGFMLEDSQSVDSYTAPPVRRPLGDNKALRRSCSSKYSFDTELSSGKRAQRTHCH